MKFRSIHHQSLSRLFLVYVLLVTGVSLLFPAIYALAYPESASELVALIKNAITAGFNMNDYKSAAPSAVQANITTLAFAVLTLHAFAIIVLNMVFHAVIVAKLIRPDVDLRTSRAAVYDPHYGLTQSPHILFRLVNASPFDLYAVTLRAFLVVHQAHPEDRCQEMIYYFPMENMDPLEIPVLKSHSPWIVAIPVGRAFSNSIIHDYEIRPAEDGGSVPGRRSIEVLVAGSEIEASAEFMHAIPLSLEADGDDGLACGRFESLPAIANRSELKRINTRYRTHEENPDRCRECAHQAKCRFLPTDAETSA